MSFIVEFIGRVEGLTEAEIQTVEAAFLHFEALVTLGENNQALLKEVATLYPKLAPFIQGVVDELPAVLPAVKIVLAKLKDKPSVQSDQVASGPGNQAGGGIGGS